MRIRVNPSARVDAYRVSDKLTITKNWTTVTKTQGKKLLALRYKGVPLLVADETETDEVEVEEPETEQE